MNDLMNQSSKTETLNSQDTIEYSIARKSKINQTRKMISVLSLCISFLLLAFYFTLPTFQCKNIPVVGFVNLKKEDIRHLSGNDGYRPLLLLNKNASAKKIVSSSCGLVTSAAYENNGITASVRIEEDFPHAKILNGAEKSYFLSGKECDAVISSLGSLSLSSERIKEIKDTLTSQTQKLPLIHFPKENFEINETNIALALSPLSPFTYSTLSFFDDIQYLNEAGDSTWNNVCDFIVNTQGKWFVLKDCLADNFSKYFPTKNFPDITFRSLNDCANTMKASAYKFKDSGKEISAYFFKPYFSSEGKVGWIKA